MTDLPSRQRLLYDAATRWSTGASPRGADEVVDAAALCLADGIDSPSLRLLAGASPHRSTAEIQSLVASTLSELGLPAPGALPHTQAIGSDGRIAVRLPCDTIRFEVVSTEPALPGHEVLVHVNGVEMTRIGAGMGMDPFGLLLPENLLAATTTPRRVGIARCGCGTYGCGATDVVIVRAHDAVHWDWELEAPLPAGVTFPAEAYDAEVARMGADRSWERPEDTSARLVLTQVDHARLAASGVRMDWVARDHADDSQLKIGLAVGDTSPTSGHPDYQVFVRVPRAGRTPEDVAAEALDVLAGPGWRREDLGRP